MKLSKFSDSLKKFNKSKISSIIKLIIGLLILFLFFRSIDLNKTLILFADLSWVNILILIFLTIIRNSIGAVRLHLLIHHVKKIRISKLMIQYFVASFYNNFLPTSIGGDAIRINMLSKEGLTSSQSVVFVLIERLIGFYALLLIAFVSGLFWFTDHYIFKFVLVGFILYSIAIVILFALKKNYASKYNIINQLQSAVKEISKNKKAVLYTLFFSIIYQVVSIFVSYYLCMLIIPDNLFVEFLTLVPIVWFATMIPISLGGLGLREFSFTYLLAFIGITAEMSAFISLGTYFTLLLSGFIGLFFQARIWINKYQSKLNTAKNKINTDDK